MSKTVAQYRAEFRAGLTNPMHDNNEKFAQWLAERINALEAVNLGSGAMRMADDAPQPPYTITTTQPEGGALTILMVIGPDEKGKTDDCLHDVILSDVCQRCWQRVVELDQEKGENTK